MSFNFSPKIVKDGLVIYVDTPNPKSFVSGNTTWNDLTLNKLNGVLTSGVLYDPSYLGVLKFDGVDDLVNFGNNPLISLTSSFTLSLWFLRLGIGGQTEEAIFHKESNVAPRGGCQIAMDRTTQKVSFRIRDAVGAFQLFTTSNAIIPNVWNQVVCSYDINNLRVKIYLNGVNEVNSSTTITGLGASNVSLCVGATSTLTSFNFNGYISNFMVYNKVLSDNEVIQNYNTIKSRLGR